MGSPHILLSELPDDPVDMGVAVDGNGPGVVLWMVDDDGVVHISDLSQDDQGRDA